MKFQSNLNEIDKFEQKSQADSSSKVYEWPSKDEAHVESKYKSETNRVEQTSEMEQLNWIELDFGCEWINCFRLSVRLHLFAGGAAKISSSPFSILRIPLLLILLAIPMT